MRITPLDIRKQEFRKAMRGLDAEEVYAFLATVADEYEAVLNDNKALRERLLELDDKVQEYRSMEKTLRDTLLTAERVTADAKEHARREAELIVKEAQVDAEQAVRHVKEEANRLRAEVQTLRSQREGYLARMRVIAESLLKFIESAQRDFGETDADVPAGTLDRPTAPPPPASVSSRDLFEAAPHPAPTVTPAADAAPVPAAGGPVGPGGSDAPAAAPPSGPAPDARPAAVAPAPEAPGTGRHEPAAGGTAATAVQAPPADPTTAAAESAIADIHAILERMRTGADPVTAAGPAPAPEAPAAPARPEPEVPVGSAWDAAGGPPAEDEALVHMADPAPTDAGAPHRDDDPTTG